MLSDFFNGTKLNKIFNPDEAVAYGAAIQAAILSGDTSKSIQNLHILDIVPFSYAPKGVPQIEVAFNIDADGLLTVSVKDKLTGNYKTVKITKSEDSLTIDNEKPHEITSTKQQLLNYCFSIQQCLEDANVKKKISSDDNKKVEEKYLSSNIGFRRYNNKLLNYTVLICDNRDNDDDNNTVKLRLNENDEGKVFKIFVERDQWNYPCLINIPSRVFVYLFIKFHKPSIVTLTSGNGGKSQFSHTGQTILPKLHEPTIYGPVYVPCEKSVIVFRSRGFDESLSFSFSYPTKEFIQCHPDPLSCNEEYQNPQLRRVIGYSNAPWLKEEESNLHQIRNRLKKEWKKHRKTAFDPL